MRIKVIGEIHGVTIIETADKKIIEIDNENIRAVRQVIRLKCEINDIYDLDYIYDEVASYYGFMRVGDAWKKNFDRLCYYPLKIMEASRQIKIKNHTLKRLKC